MTPFRIRPTPNLGFLLKVVIDNISVVKRRWGEEGVEVPHPLTAMALLDTGAAISGLSRRVIEALRLPSESDKETVISTPGGERRSVTRFGSLQVREEPRLKAAYTQFVEFAMPSMPFDVVIGLPVLLAWNIEYRTASGELRLWPGR